jgi:CofD-related protein of GAK system
MEPPGDLRNRLMALSDMTRRGNPEVSRLFRTRLPREGGNEALRQALEQYLDEDCPQLARIEPRYRRIILRHLRRFAQRMPTDFDLRGGNIGNFVIAGAYLDLGNLESVIFEFSALAAVRGEVLPVCLGGAYHLKAIFDDQTEWIGQSRITSNMHPPIARLAIVELKGDQWLEVRPAVNPLVPAAIEKAALVAYTMGSFYTSLVSNLLVPGESSAIRQAKRPKVFVANLTRDIETPGMSVSGMLKELYRYLCLSDEMPGRLSDYVQYVLVGTHEASEENNRLPIDLAAIRDFGVEPIVLPLEDVDAEGRLVHNVELVAAVLLSLC